MVGAWGWRKKISPEEEFSTTGEVLLACKGATATTASVKRRMTAAS